MQKMKMKETRTPMKLFGIRYYKDEDGQYYKKVGSNHRFPVTPFWKKKRVKLGLPVVLLAVIGFFGYQIGMDLASEKVVKEISHQVPKQEIQALLTDPSVQQFIEDEVGSEKKQRILDKYSVVSMANTPLVASASSSAAAGNEGGSKTSKKSTETEKPTASSKLKFSSRDEVMKFLLTKFTMSELMGFADKAKGGLTPEVKSEIQSTVMSRLTPEEYEALKLYAVIELSKS
ncbi:hypothetical protein PH210_23460 [Paenibacillus sp. BSR1-1]|uniref:hypothetical protein n=1 Tax=Paenibacillus sp. BSR1-1 TaxID=3020845 RepID=UPI0025AFACE4|nr:hypothetical protein [Paenibacillus sp. BSR1-1]MDN3019134.1 hypothetical protein [Paenibacillus sp. BSR1-1]